MLWRVLAAVLIFSAATSQSCQCASKHRMPPGSFITRPVSSPQELGSLIMSDTITSRRFVNHFGLESDKIAGYFQKNLTIKTLEKAGIFSVYYVNPNGRTVVKNKRLKAGTVVFVDETGRPVLEAACGNPMVKVIQIPETPKPFSSMESYSADIVQTASSASFAPEPSSEPVIIAPPAPGIEVLPAIATLAAVVPALLGVTAVHDSKPIPEPSGLIALGVCVIAFMATLKRFNSYQRQR